MRTSAEEANKELTKTESKLRGEMGDVKGSLVSKVDSDVAAVSFSHPPFPPPPLPPAFPLSRLLPSFRLLFLALAFHSRSRSRSR